MTERRLWLRVVLAALAVEELMIGIWALVDPAGFYRGFPGLGRHWASADGPYNHHFVGDTGAGFFAVGVLLVIAVVWMHRDVIRAAFVVVIAHAFPHFLYHLTHPAKALSGADNALSTGGLAVVTAVAIVCLIALARGRDAVVAG